MIFSLKMARAVEDTSKWPSIPEMYKGRSILITGGSGFMGKVLVEKLLYSCPDVAKIYLLLRTKRGLSEEARITEMMKLPVSTILNIYIFNLKYKRLTMVRKGSWKLKYNYLAIKYSKQTNLTTFYVCHINT